MNMQSVSSEVLREHPILHTSLFVDKTGVNLFPAVDQEERVKNTRWPNTS